MRRMRGVVAGLAMTTLTVSAFAGTAQASGPEIHRYYDSGAFVDRDLCGFPLHVAYQDQGTFYEWFDASGNLVRFTKHAVFSEVVRANGKVATGVDRQNIVDTQQGYDVFSGSWIFFMPDGSHIQNAGRIQIPYADAGQILSEHGPHPIEEGRLAELFCPPMA